ncbi:polysaccharide biosynthesis tyrosine autokinase [Nocardioides sp.]|uniref:polysaccharide biosynthesis tyrosine autokinase n=1 Tax=Nocardioides sp. TaxID=35761 RepID=UPI0035178AEB
MPELLGALIRRWRLLLVAVLLGVAAASALTALQPSVYRATSQVFVSVRENSDAIDRSLGQTFLQSRIKSYARVVSSPLVLDDVIDELDLDQDAADLASRIHTRVPPYTVLLEIAVDDEDPARAAEIADAVAARFSTVVSDIEQARTEQDSPVQAELARPAVVPEERISPIPAYNLSLGLLLGLIVGTLVVGVRERIDTRVATDDDIAEATDLPTLAVIPEARTDYQVPLLGLDHADPVWAEGYRRLRTNLSYSASEGHLRRIAICSPLGDEGRTLTAVNLALSYADAGFRPVLVDADLRGSAVARTLGLVHDVGLSDVLAGLLPLTEVVQRHGGLDVVAGGPTVPNPSEILGSGRFQRLVRELLDTYDVVILDTPPLLSVTDAAVVSTCVDATVLLARAEITTRMQLKRALTALCRVDAVVAGAVLNRSDVTVSSGYRYEYTASTKRRRSRS